MRLRSMLALCAATATAVSLLGVPAGAAESAPKPRAAKPGPSDIREIPADREYRLAPGLQRARQRMAAGDSSRSALAAGETPAVGTVRQWIALDDFNGQLYRKDYTLRGVGDKIEVWVANDTDASRTVPGGLPQQHAGDHRRDGRPGRRPGPRVRHEHVPEGVRRVQRRRPTGTGPTRGPDSTDRATTPVTATRS